MVTDSCAVRSGIITPVIRGTGVLFEIIEAGYRAAETRQTQELTTAFTPLDV